MGYAVLDPNELAPWPTPWEIVDGRAIGQLDDFEVEFDEQGRLTQIRCPAWPLGVTYTKGLLGIECLIFAVHRLAAARRIDAAPARPRSLARASPWSAISGFTSTLAHAGAPPVMIYLLSRRQPRETFVATSVFFVAVINLAKLPFYIGLDLFSRETLVMSALFIPLVPIGVWSGMRILKHIPERPFYLFATAALGLSGVKLLWDGVMG